MNPPLSHNLRRILGLAGLAALCCAGEWLALRGAALAWRLAPKLGDWQAGSAPFYAACLVELALIALVTRGRLRSHLWPDRWDGLGVRGLLMALLLGPIGLEGLLRWKLPHWHAPISPLAFVSGAILGPFAEEWAFRGILWRASEAAFGEGRWTPVGVAAFTSLLFGLWHIPFQPTGSDLAAIVLANTAFGLCLALARARLGALLPGTLVHALGNAFYLLTG